VIRIDPTTEHGMYSWDVDGINQIYQHWFWYASATNAPQISLDHFGKAWGELTASNSVTVSFYAPGATVIYAITLHGGTSGNLASDLIENLTLQSSTNTPLAIRLYEYSDFDLANNGNSDALSFPSTSSALQQGAGMVVTETIQTNLPQRSEGSWYDITLAKLDGSAPLQLSDAQIPATPGDQTFAFEWDAALASGGAFTIASMKSIRPAPPSLSIVSTGLTVTLSWPAAAGNGFKLQSRDALGVGPGWQFVTNAPVTSSGFYQISLNPSAGSQFYRLAWP
jgi:hypothetical protein